jgi:hypothetical protein
MLAPCLAFDFSRRGMRDEAGAGYCKRVFWNKDSMRAVATKKMFSCKCLNRSLIGSGRLCRTSKVRIFIVLFGRLRSRFATLRSAVQPAPSHLLRVVPDHYFLVCLSVLRQVLFSSLGPGTVVKPPSRLSLITTGRGFPVAE